MSETNKDIQERSRGQLAQQIVESDTYQTAWIAIRAQILSDFARTKFTETEARDECWRKLQNLDRLEAQFASVMRDGKVAEQRISVLQKAKNTVKSVMG